MDSQFLISILFTTLLLSFLSLLFLMDKKTKASGRRKLLPPGPRKLPLIGNLHLLSDLPHRSLQNLSNKYGPLMFLKLGSIPTLVVSSADIAREIFRTHDLAFSGRAAFYVLKKLSNGCSNVSFAPYSEHWRELRKILILELLSTKRVHSFKAIRDEEVKFMVDAIASTSTTTPVNLSELTLVLANNVVCRVAFGRQSSEKREDDEKGRFCEILREIQDLSGGFNIADYFPWMAWLNKFNGLEARLEKNFKELDSYFDRVIGEHLNPQRAALLEHDEDIVDVLLRLQKDLNQAMTLLDQHIKGLLLDIFVAGTDTSAATLIWTMAELIRNPSAMRKAQDEVREVVKGEAKVEESDLPKLDYLKLVIKETLRLHPPVPLLLPRETIESCTLAGYEIPVKTWVFINATSIGTDPNIWENPNEFNPERFLGNPIDFRGQHFELLPFGSGRRGCPGINFAVVVVELALANLLYHFDWALPQGVKVEDIDMGEAVGVTTHKKIPLYLVAFPASVV